MQRRKAAGSKLDRQATEESVITKGMMLVFGIIGDECFVLIDLAGGMKSLAFLLLSLGGFIALAVQFSFWAALGMVYFAGMLLVTVISFTARRPSTMPSFEVLDDTYEGTEVVRPETVKGLRAA